MTDTDQLIQYDYSEMMKTSFRDYAMSVIIARALPDVRDGLKPVQRRILYAMDELGLDPGKPHRKSARIVGDTMGKYHPHGDSSIYDALVHMSEDWSLSVPLVDGHGNFGSIDGDGAAAMRYTEARLSVGAQMLLGNLDKDLVDFVPNFDDSEKEPSVLPAMIPNLMINGTTGIAVGMATNIPPHNAAEVIDGCIAFIDDPAITIEELMHYIPGPDFPTGGIIVNGDAIRDIYTTGEGRLKIRAKTELEKGDNGKTNIVVTEIPYTSTGNKTRLVESLVALLRDKVFDEISDVRDESSKEGIRIVIEVRKDRDVQNLLNGLFKKSALEDTYTVNLLAVRENQPTVFNLKALLREFLDFQEILYTREHRHLLAKARQRLEIVDGLLRATDIIDLIIEILRGSTSIKQAKECLMFGNVTDIRFKSETSRIQAFKLDFTQAQADAILAMPLSKLIGLEILKLEEEKKELEAAVERYTRILADRNCLHEVIKERLKEYRGKLERPRRTVIDNFTTQEYVVETKVEDMYVLIDRFGYAKTIDETAYNKASSESLREYPNVIRMKSDDALCIFTAEGDMLRIRGEKIPRGRVKDKGTLIHNLCKLEDGEAIFFCSGETLMEVQLMFVTEAGFIKRVSGVELDTQRLCMAATKLDDKDKVAAIVMIPASELLAGNRRVFIYTHAKLGCIFTLDEVPELKKTGRGVRAITLEKGDKVEAAAVYDPEVRELEIAGKKTDPRKIRIKLRGGKGSKLTFL